MDVLIYDHEMNLVRLMDSYSSLVWTERYNQYGEFSIVAPYTDDLFKILTDGNGLINHYYARIKESNVVMVIEDVDLQTGVVEGNTLKITGRSLESILDRRVIYGLEVLYGGFQNGIKTLLTKNAINPTNNARAISGLIFRDSDDPSILSEELYSEFYFDNLYETIEDLCKVYGFGFRIVLDGENMVFELYSGADRSRAQEVNPFVVFSPRYDNLISSEYFESSNSLETVAIVSGDGDEYARPVIEVPANMFGTLQGLDRRELYVDAESVSRTYYDDDGNRQDLSDAEYITMLIERGHEELVTHQYKKTFDGEVDPYLTFQYGVDYFIGDVVEIENEYGISARARVTEFIRSFDSNGYKEYPTFENIDV